MTLRVLNPATAETVAELDQAGVEDTDRAVAAARAAFPAWRAVNPRDRARLLRRPPRGGRPPPPPLPRGRRSPPHPPPPPAPPSCRARGRARRGARPPG